MPNRKLNKRGSRGKRKQKGEQVRPAQEQAARLRKAINKCIKHKTPADQQDITPGGVHWVSVDSDSDQALSGSKLEEPAVAASEHLKGCECAWCRLWEESSQAFELGATSDLEDSAKALNVK